MPLVAVKLNRLGLCSEFGEFCKEFLADKWPYEPEPDSRELRELFKYAARDVGEVRIIVLMSRELGDSLGDCDKDLLLRADPRPNDDLVEPLRGLVNVDDVGDEAVELFVCSCWITALT